MPKKNRDSNVKSLILVYKIDFYIFKNTTMNTNGLHKLRSILLKCAKTIQQPNSILKTYICMFSFYGHVCYICYLDNMSDADPIQFTFN